MRAIIKYVNYSFYFQLVGTFFIKASSYEFMKFNQLAGAENYFYSFEYYGDHSLWNFLFPGDQPPIPRGVTHGDELLYLFSTGVFNFQVGLSQILKFDRLPRRFGFGKCVEY